MKIFQIVKAITKSTKITSNSCINYHEEIPLRLVCVSRGACLVNMLPGVQVTAGLGFFLCSAHLSDQQ